MERQPLKLSMKGHQIRGIEPNSIASELGIAVGSYLLAIDNVFVIDVFDFRMRELASELTVRILTETDELVEYDIEKDDGETLGLVFENPMLSACTHCHNACVFCFIDQLPSGMRETLYFKDDDLRLSFLTGNYVTLTNLSEKEFERLISYKFSPLNISVHATEPLIRQKMMGHPKSGQLMDRLKRLTDASIKLNTQIVLCPNYNDGIHLERTLDDLISLGDNLQSVAIVPVGITRFRKDNRLVELTPVSMDAAVEVIETVTNYQEKLLKLWGRRIVFAADEFYLKAGVPLPDEATYEGYPQLENGVGMATLFETDMKRLKRNEYREMTASFMELALPTSFNYNRKDKYVICLLTGTLAAPIINRNLAKIWRYSGLSGEVVAVPNEFFGADITVAGLLTGCDLINAFRRWQSCQPEGQRAVVVIPGCMLRQGENVLLDDVTIDMMAEQISVPVVVVEEDAMGLVSGLKWIKTKLCS